MFHSVAAAEYADTGMHRHAVKMHAKVKAKESARYTVWGFMVTGIYLAYQADKEFFR
jgi:hypothetical protein